MRIDRRNFLEVMSIGTALVPVLPCASAFASENDSGTQDTGTKLVQMDPNVSFAKQIEHNVAPVILLSTFLVKPEHVAHLLRGFQRQFAVMRKQPGFISAQLHRGIEGSCLFMNYVVWESTDAFKHGFESPEFQAQLKPYPPGTEVSAFIFQRWRYLVCVSVSLLHHGRLCAPTVLSNDLV
ncbi:MAG TPA: antibiotic biosynthesis monooxygenase family protein [Bryobacteraceae bacterium]|jgi:heme-degrading monooxygenase HmoA|nr:antibiotic biosynthesis monooxygenase family protein [Bryobacteraceae bacterium]